VAGGAPADNQNAAKRRLFEATVRRAITQDDGIRLRAAAEKLLSEATAKKAFISISLSMR